MNIKTQSKNPGLKESIPVELAEIKQEVITIKTIVDTLKKKLYCSSDISIIFPRNLICDCEIREKYYMRLK